MQIVPISYEPARVIDKRLDFINPLFLTHTTGVVLGGYLHCHVATTTAVNTNAFDGVNKIITTPTHVVVLQGIFGAKITKLF